MDSKTKAVYEKEFIVGSADTDLFEHLRPSSLLQKLQEMATEHAILLGVSRDVLVERYGAFWMLVRLWYRLERPIRSAEAFRILTWHRGAKGATIHRDFDLICADEWVGEAVTAWVIARLDTKTMLRPSTIEEMTKSAVPNKVKEDTLTRMRLPDEWTQAETRGVFYSDTDINGHMNNKRYIDIACDALHYEKMKGVFVRQAEVNYVKECFAGEELTVLKGEKDGRSFVQGRGADGKPRFDVGLSFDKY